MTKSDFPRKNRIKHEQKQSMRKALSENKRFGKTSPFFHPSKNELHSGTHTNRYNKITNKSWVVKNKV